MGFSQEAAQAVVCDHGYDAAKKLSHLKLDDVEILIKTLHYTGRECNDGTKDPGIGITLQRALLFTCFTLFNSVCCNLCPMINTINYKNA